MSYWLKILIKGFASEQIKFKWIVVGQWFIAINICDKQGNISFFCETVWMNFIFIFIPSCLLQKNSQNPIDHKALAFCASENE